MHHARRSRRLANHAPTPPRWTPFGCLAAAALFAFAVVTNIATVFNNAYSQGATFYDSTYFQTIIWRSGPALKLPASFGGMSSSTSTSRRSTTCRTFSAT